MAVQVAPAQLSTSPIAPLPVSNAGKGANHQTVNAPNKGVVSGATVPSSGQLWPRK
jgi:hypothetical protein